MNIMGTRSGGSRCGVIFQIDHDHPRASQCKRGDDRPGREQPFLDEIVHKGPEQRGRQKRDEQVADESSSLFGSPDEAGEHLPHPRPVQAEHGQNSTSLNHDRECID